MALERLGPYRIERQLGQGGMGTVYAAVNEQTGEPAAVKVLSTLLGAHENFRLRFESEVETLKRLRHPSIVQLLGFGEHEGHLFYAMELIDGASLHDELKSGRRFTWQEVIRFGIALSAALKLAHDSGVIHRDLKPANVMLTRDGQIKLMDFGIARLFGSTQLTADGGVVGTIDFMAPEQAEAQPVTIRSDLYSLGAVFYALLTGRPPFAGKTLAQVVHALRYDTPIPLNRLAPDTPEELCLLVEQLLEKDPKNRIPTALILGNRLRAIEHGLNLRAAQARIEPSEPDDGEEDYRLADDQRTSGGESPKTRTVAGTDMPTRAGRAPQGKETIVPNTIESAPGAALSPAAAAAAWGDVTQVNPAGSNIPRTGHSGSDLRNQQTLADQPSRATPTASHFTTIDEDERRRIRTEREEIAESRRLAWLRGAIVVLAGCALSFGLWWLTRPPSADRLYARIAAVAESNDLDELAGAEGDIDLFVQHYASDSRCDEVRDWKERLEARRETRRLARRAKATGSPESLTTSERMYAEAAQRAGTDPAEALRRMEALVDLFAGVESPDAAVRRSLDLAKQQIPQLRSLVARQQQEDLALATARLDWADGRRQEDPEAARRVYAGIVTLWQDRPWAQKLVERARKSL